jgi:hypothetical protein
MAQDRGLRRRTVQQREMPPEADPINGRRSRLWKTCQCVPNQNDLSDVGSAIGAGREMQPDSNLGQQRKTIV